MGTHGQFQIHLRGMALLLNNNEIKHMHSQRVMLTQSKNILLLLVGKIGVGRGPGSKPAWFV